MFDPKTNRLTGAGFDPAPIPRRAVAAWREDVGCPDLAPAVLAALKAAPAADPPRPARWRHVALAVTAAGLLVAAGQFGLKFVPPPAAVETAEFAALPTPDPPATVPEAAPVLPVPAAAVPRPVPRERVAGLFPAPPRMNEMFPAEAFTPERLAAAWSALPDPNRTWRDEVRDGVRPYRDGVDTVVTLFAEALPPRRAPY